MAKPVLGRGLGALLGGVAAAPRPAAAPAPASTVPLPATEAPSAVRLDQVQRVPLSRVHRCPFQPRKDFTPEALQELADSIREQGIVQPLLVRPRDDDFELIAGERRWRAAQLLGLTELPVIVREADDRTVLELALIENLQRENLNPLEEALGYAQLIEQFELKQDEVAQKVGKSRTAVTNSLRLLKLSPFVQDHLRAGRISVGHAKVILGLGTDTDQKHAADKIISQSLNVRQTEELVSRLQQQLAAPPSPSGIAHSPASAPPRDVHVADLENRLKQRLGTRVSLRYRDGKGALDIRFFSDDELNRLLQIMGVELD